MKRFIFLIILFCFSQVVAQKPNVTLDELKNKSSDIVLAKTISLNCFKKNNRTYTDIVIEVLDGIKGSLKAKDFVTMTYFGGTINGITTSVLDNNNPSFKVAEESVVFLNNKNDKTSPRIIYFVQNGARSVSENIVFSNSQ